MKPSIEQRVFCCLDVALENNYDMTKVSSNKVADDIVSYADYDFAEEIESMDHTELFEQVRASVEKWQNMKNMEK